MRCTGVFSKNIRAFNEKKRFIVNQGGARSSKTYSVLQLLLLICQRAKGSRLISVVSETLPHLKKGAMRDFIAILEEDGLYSESMHNKTDNIFSIKSLDGKFTSYIEFFGADSGDKVRGPQRDYLFLNEANNLDWETYYQLAIRTAKTIFIDFNPVSEFWVHTELLPSLQASHYEFIKSTYRDNEYLSEHQVADIERRALRDDNFRLVYAEGEIGSLEGLIYKHWKLCDDLPTTDKRIIGIDFGFTNDPTVITDVRQYNGEWWADEVTYQTGLLNNDIARIIKGMGLRSGVRVVCDSAEQKSIEDLKRMGINAEPCEKGAGSIVAGIDYINSMPINITRRSLNAHKELRNYKWKTDKSGKALNEPIDNWNHFCDSFRYAGNAFKKIVPITPARYTF